MATSPEQDAQGVVRVALFSDGVAVPESMALVSIDVVRAINKVPTARLVIADGDVSTLQFSVSDTQVFSPGATIKVNAGHGDDEATIFEGIVVKHAVQISGNNDARLVIECRDKAIKMTVGRKSANHLNQRDSDVIGALIANAGLTADVDTTEVQQRELVQYHCTDWDFLLARAEASGLLVIATDGTVTVKAPATRAEPALKVAYGRDLMAFDAELDVRSQYASVDAVSWDMATQSVVGAEAGPATLPSQGDLDSGTLAKVIGLTAYRLQTSAPQTEAALTQWAEAQQLKSGLARVRGSMRFRGSAKASVGGIIEVEGVGKRFSGKVFVSGVTHTIGDGDWVTEARFGLSPEWSTEQADVTAPGAGGLLPAVDGLQIGVVMKLDGDPDGEQRIQVAAPVMQAETEGVWARLLQWHASDGFGAFFLPEIGDEVVLGYFNNDPSHPVILGSLYSSNRPPPCAMCAENHVKAIVTRCKSRIEFDEDKKRITITTPGNNKIVVSDEGRSIVLHDQNDNKVALDPSGITLDSPKDIKLTATGRITLDAVGGIGISSKSDVGVAGLNIRCDAKVGFTGKGAASAELSAGGPTTVKGAMVMIN